MFFTTDLQARGQHRSDQPAVVLGTENSKLVRPYMIRRRRWIGDAGETNSDQEDALLKVERDMFCTTDLQTREHRSDHPAVVIGTGNYKPVPDPCNANLTISVFVVPSGQAVRSG
jgi:hypothetical protein